MRKLAMLSTALIGLAFSSQAFAQSQSAPQPGLPPGASIGAQNAQPPRSTGQLTTTTTQAAPPSPMMAPTPTAAATPPAHRVRRRRVRRVRHVTHPAPAAAPSASQ